MTRTGQARLANDTGHGKRFAEFFAGIGLVRLGLERAGWQCVFANDIDPKKWEMYQANFTDRPEHFHLCDVRAVRPRDVPQVDLATASFPCTDLSLAGARRGLAGSSSSALWPFVELLRQLDILRPQLVLLENVVGFLTSHAGGDFRTALLELNRLGYSVDTFILDACHFVPQSRPRLFVLGQYTPTALIAERRRQYKLFANSLRPPALLAFIDRNPDIVWSIAELPEPPLRTTTLSDIVEQLPDDAPEWWSDERANYLSSQMSERHTQVLEKMQASETTQYGTVFRRVRNGRSMAELRTDGLAGCLRTPRGGSGRQILVEAGLGRVRIRLVTPTECARLMGAHDYRITVPTNQALFGFGDAVCVDVIEWIARNYLNRLVLQGSHLLAAEA